MKDKKEKDPNAVKLGKKRWEGISDEEKSEHGRKAVNARWKKNLTKKKKAGKI